MNISAPMRPYIPKYLRMTEEEYAQERAGTYREPSPGPSTWRPRPPSALYNEAYDGFEQIELQELPAIVVHPPSSRAKGKGRAYPTWDRNSLTGPSPGPPPGLVRVGSPLPMYDPDPPPGRCHRACTLALAVGCTLAVIALPAGVVYAAIRANNRH